MVCSQFQIMGKTAEQMTIDDLKVGGEWVIGEDTIKVFNSDSTTKFDLRYIDEAMAEELRADEMPWVTAGWYDAFNDDDLENNLNKEPLPLGGTVMAFAANDNATITTAGEVVESEDGYITTVWEEGEGGLNKMVGNCTPIDRTIGDFKVGGEWVIGEDTIKIFNSDSTTKFDLRYIDEAMAEELRADEMPWVTAGWYDAFNDDDLENNLKDEPLPAGSGVMAFAANDGATIAIPSAL